MKFLLDANFPASLVTIFEEHGHDVIHTQNLPDRNRSRDGLLNQISVDEKRIIVSKDWDFYYSHLLQGRPWKLVFVRTGNQKFKEIRSTFAEFLAPMVKVLETASLVELYADRIVAHDGPASKP